MQVVCPEVLAFLRELPALPGMCMLLGCFHGLSVRSACSLEEWV